MKTCKMAMAACGAVLAGVVYGCIAGLLPARRCDHLRRDDGAVPGLLPGKHDLSQAPPPAAGG